MENKNFDQTQKIKMQQNSKTKIVTKLNKRQSDCENAYETKNCDKTFRLKL